MAAEVGTALILGATSVFQPFSSASFVLLALKFQDNATFSNCNKHNIVVPYMSVWNRRRLSYAHASYYIHGIVGNFCRCILFADSLVETHCRSDGGRIPPVNLAYFSVFGSY